MLLHQHQLHLLPSVFTLSPAIAAGLKTKRFNLDLSLKDNTQRQISEVLSSLSSKTTITGLAFEIRCFSENVPAMIVLLFRIHFEIRVLEFWLKLLLH